MECRHIFWGSILVRSFILAAGWHDHIARAHARLRAARARARPCTNPIHAIVDTPYVSRTVLMKAIS